MIRVVLPMHLRTLTGTERELQIDVDSPVTPRAILDALEKQYPMLRGTIRDHTNQRRRPFVRFFVGEKDISHDSPDEPLPDAVAEGREAFYVIGAMAGG